MSKRKPTAQEALEGLVGKEVAYLHYPHSKPRKGVLHRAEYLGRKSPDLFKIEYGDGSLFFFSSGVRVYGTIIYGALHQL